MSRSGLDDERSFLLASIEDLERERAVGDLSDHDYLALRDRYTRRAAEVIRELEADGAGRAQASPPRVRRLRPRRRRRGLAVGGVLAIALAGALLVVERGTTVRLPGQSASGSVTLSPAQKARQTLAQGETLEADGEDAQALTLYQQVLAADPTQPEALAEAGWLEYQAGVRAANPAVLASAQRLEERAVAVAPGAYAPRLYLGSMDTVEGEGAAAVTQFRLFLADRPPVAVVADAAQIMRRAFTEAGAPLPPLPASTG